MLRCLLNILLLTVIVHTLETGKLKEDLQGFKELVSAGSDKIGNLTPTTRSLNLQDLSLMVDALKPLEGKSRKKRQYDNLPNQYSDETVNNVKKDVDNITKSISLPLGGKGTSAFSVHAQTVYILYPSLFQDPNIFGRFSIPQNVNMDKNIPQENAAIPGGQGMPNQIHGRKRKRSADQASAATPPQEKKNIHTHLEGTIVVQNQDVNEFNRRESY